MYCDANGRPDQDGDFELINGKPILRDGRRIRIGSTVFRDGALHPTGFLTLDEQSFADSAEGQHLVAYAKSSYSLRARHPSFTGAQWSDQMADAVIREQVARARRAANDAALADARTRVQSTLDAVDLNAWRKA